MQRTAHSGDSERKGQRSAPGVTLADTENFMTPETIETAERGADSLDRLVRRPIRFTVEDANNCGWCFNCGPGALAAILNLTPAELRPLMGDFERKGYTNPTLMWDILNRSGAIWRKVYRSDEPGKPLPPLTHGLIRIQWSGPWTRPGVPTAARYRQTHWIAARARSEEIFDVNATCSGGWIARHEWESALVPWLLRACCPKADGGWWPTHAVEVTPNK